MKRIECIIMDWAGTAVDYGCFAPVAAFVESANIGASPVTAAETRAHMGLTKVEEIRALFNIERVRAEFERNATVLPEEDAGARYAEFQRVLFASLEDCSVRPYSRCGGNDFRTACARYPHWLHHRLYPLYDGCCAACRHSQRLCGR